MLEPILFALLILNTVILPVLYRLAYNAGYTKAHRKHNPGVLIPADKYRARNSVLRF